jgi:ParB-like chromosome segregation protein Spo0J
MADHRRTDYGWWLSSAEVPQIAGVHEYAELYPRMTPEEFATLLADILANGQREPVVLMLDGQVLDGRHRLEACQELGIEPWCVLFVGSDGMGSEEDALEYVRARNAARRHSTPSQRAMTAARERKFALGFSQEARARRHGVSERMVQYADKVLDSDNQDVIGAVDAGMSVSRAAKELAEAEEVRLRAERDARLAEHANKGHEEGEVEHPDWPLDEYTPARHVATVLADATSPVSIRELAAGYAPDPADLYRIRQHVSPNRPVEWLVQRALRRLGSQVEFDGSGWRLTVPFEDLTLEGDVLHRYDKGESLPFLVSEGEPSGDARQVESVPEVDERDGAEDLDEQPASAPDIAEPEPYSYEAIETSEPETDESSPSSTTSTDQPRPVQLFRFLPGRDTKAGWTYEVWKNLTLACGDRDGLALMTADVEGLLKEVRKRIEEQEWAAEHRGGTS